MIPYIIRQESGFQEEKGCSFASLKDFLGRFIDAMLYNFKVGQNALIQAIRKVSLINSVYTYTNIYTFTAGFDQPTTDFNTKSSNLHVAVSQMRALVLAHDKIQANCKET